jgi:hypothetical protein
VYAKPQKFFELKSIAIITFTQPLSLQIRKPFHYSKTKKTTKVKDDSNFETSKNVISFLAT